MCKSYYFSINHFNKLPPKNGRSHIFEVFLQKPHSNDRKKIRILPTKVKQNATRVDEEFNTLEQERV